MTIFCEIVFNLTLHPFQGTESQKVSPSVDNLQKQVRKLEVEKQLAETQAKVSEERMLKYIENLETKLKWQKTQIDESRKELLKEKERNLTAFASSKKQRQAHRRVRERVEKSLRVDVEKKRRDNSEYIKIKKSVTDDAIVALLKRITGENTGAFDDPNLRSFAITLHFYSPQSYMYLRQVLKPRDNPKASILPSERTLRNWFSSIDGKPGFTSESLNALEALSKREKRQLPVSLMLDDMAIHKGLNVATTGNSGGIDLGPDSENLQALKVRKEEDKGNEGDEGDEYLATEVCVFMAVCMDLPLKIPVGYFVHDGLNADQLATLARQCMIDLYSVGVVVRAIVADGLSANRRMAKLLGADINPVSVAKLKPGRAAVGSRVTENKNFKPFFKHPSDSNIRVHYFMDICHMIKLVRNALGNRKTLKNRNGETICWNYITKLHNLQLQQGLKFCNKLSSRHIEWDKNKQKVCYATQTLSKSVATALAFCNNTLMMPDFKDSTATSQFLNTFNDLFDIFNSSSSHRYGLKAPMTCENEESWSRTFNDAKNYILGLQIMDPKTNEFRSVFETKRKVGFQGFLVGIESVKNLFNDVVRNGSMPYLSTKKLSQDHLEAFFGQCRQKFGPNPNPTAALFESAYKQILIGAEIKASKSANILSDEDIKILHTEKTGEFKRKADMLKKAADKELRECIVSELVYYSNFLPNPCMNRLPNFAPNVKAVVGYVAGYTVRSLREKTKCPQCREALTAVDTNSANIEKYSALISFKTINNGLTVPTRAQHRKRVFNSLGLKMRHNLSKLILFNNQ
ncbi:hypothetical protein FOCC_FOCC000039 [Frankliniella occidentalis]|nr:hypothetical protein FOCC_FOCC000039 [Frankliniella occidentalis]